MKNFKTWLEEVHPEYLDEGLLDNMARSKFLRNATVAAGMLAGMGGLSNVAHAAQSNKPAASVQDEDPYELTDKEEAQLAHLNPSDYDVAREKILMKRMAEKVPQKTSVNNGVTVSRGSAHMSGGKVVSKAPVKLSAPKQNAAPKTKLPQLNRGPMQSHDFGGAVE